MDARHWHPAPPRALDAQLRLATHDLRRARVDLALGRLDPQTYHALAGDLDARLRRLESERLAQMRRAPPRFFPS